MIVYLKNNRFGLSHQCNALQFCFFRREPLLKFFNFGQDQHRLLELYSSYAYCIEHYTAAGYNRSYQYIVVKKSSHVIK